MMNMRKAITAVLLSVVTWGHAQQLPDFTQYPSLLFQLNPAYTGTKGNLDMRLNYRKQWMGYTGAPVTQFAGLHSRLFKGKLGLGGTVYKDVTGPSQRFNYGFSAAYHLRFPDVEFSLGIGMNFNKYTMNSGGLTTHWDGDPAIVLAQSGFDKNKNAMAGALLYNDRFHFGLGVVNMFSTKANFGAVGGNATYAQHYYFTCGYNFHGHPDYVWENNLLATYVSGAPITINYNLRVHYRERFTFGAGWRMRDAVALQAGMIIWKNIQAIYSYDFGISRLRKAHSGSHEITLGYRFDYDKKKSGYRNFDQFQRQKYNIF
ncbi:MAG: type IX secretion system membrane protein PorP/SprF [Bacteroidia bacterium]